MDKFTDALFQQDGPPKKPKVLDDVAALERRLEAIKAEKQRRINPPASATTGKPVYDKAKLEALNAEEREIRIKLAKARADAPRAKAKP